MPLNIKNPRTEELARELAWRTGESITETITIALEERLAREPSDGAGDVKRREVEALLAELDALPDLDGRTPEEILGCSAEPVE